jgi:quinol monooxygenase YgiN
MSSYAVAERRVQPGRMADFVEATRMVGEHYARRRFAQGQFNLYVDESDPDTALLVGSWPDQEHFEAAHADIPDGLLGALNDAMVPGASRSWEWYRPLREVMTFSHRPDVLVALRFRVAPAEAARFEKWARSVQDAAAALHSVVATRVLLGRDDPTQALYLGEYRDAAAVDDVARLTAQMPAPVDLREQRRFLGRVGYSWKRLDRRA